MLNYPDRPCPSSAQLRATPQLALLIYIRSLQGLQGSNLSEQWTGYLNIHLNNGSPIMNNRVGGTTLRGGWLAPAW
jgi:hypothetical protein